MTKFERVASRKFDKAAELAESGDLVGAAIAGRQALAELTCAYDAQNHPAGTPPFRDVVNTERDRRRRL